LLARCLLPLVDGATSLRALFVRSCDQLPPEGSPHWFSAVGADTMMLPVASSLYWAKVMSGESSGTIHWIDSMIVWSLIVLKSGFRF
jgi:hypothetical protein